MRPTRLLIGGGVLVVAIAAGLVAASWLTTPGVVAPIATGPSDSPPPLAFAKLDGPSRALAEGLSTGEVVTASLFARDDDRVAEITKRARNAGLKVEPTGGEEPLVTVTGAHEAILELATLSPVAAVQLHEDMRAMRLVAEPLPPGWSMPVPGLPYADAGIPLDPARITAPPDRRAALLAALAGLVVTIDGQPYPELVASGACSGEPATDCWVRLEGTSVKDSDLLDVWPIHASVATGWLAMFDRGDPPMFHAVPRRLGREAERIARMDEAALERIREYQWIPYFAWNPTQPGTVEIGYGRVCGGGFGGPHVASLLQGPIAEDGGCYEYLTVTVDVAAGQVIGMR